MIEEARRILAAKASDALPDLDSLLEATEQLPTMGQAPDLLASIPLPEKDQPVMAAAILGSCDALVTGDRTHFGPLFGTVFQGVALYSPAELGRILL